MNQIPLVDGRRRVDLAYGVIRQRLLSGEWPSGWQISIDGLKAELGVSKQPIMDALKRLSADGLIEIIPQVGCRVPTFSMEERFDFFSIFASLESECCAVAARRATPDEIVELVRLNEQIVVEGLRDLDPAVRASQYLVLNREFHRVLLRLAHSSILARVSERMWDVSDLMINTAGGTGALANEIEQRYEEHKQIISALEVNDVGGARSAMQGHILRNIPMLGGEVSD